MYIKRGQTNKIEQVTAIFWKKLNEGFTIKYEGRCYKAYFKKSGEEGFYEKGNFDSTKEYKRCKWSRIRKVKHRNKKCCE